MRKRVTSIVSLVVLLCMMLVCLAPALTVRAESEADTFQKEAEMNLDVVFVLDASGSMLTSDPKKVALDAFNLFVDLCDETCSVGYVVYTEKIKDFSDLTSIKNKSSLDRMKQKIADIQYDPNGDTDIALGLTKAMNLQSMYRATDQSRKKVIVLLSDGNTHLIGSTRTEADSRKEMETTLQTLNEKKIPVYSIGLNYDKSLDKKELENISTKTNGQTFETSTSAELPAITSEIFSDIYQLEGEPKEIVNGTVTINIKDSSVFYVNIIIRSNFTLTQLDPQVTDPKGKKIDIYNDEHVKVTSTGTYTLIKMIYPMTGDWKIKLRNATNENCKVTQLDFYSIYIKQTVPEAIALGDSFNIEVTLKDREGVVTDEDLLKTIRMSTTISDKDGNDFTVVLNRESGGKYTATYKPTAFGVYHVKTTAMSDKFQKESRSVSLTVQTAAEMDLLKPSEEQKEEGEPFNWMMVVIIAASVAIGVVVVIVIAYLISKRKDKQPVAVTAAPPPPAPKPQYVPEKPVVMPEAKAPEYIGYQVVEHDKLENLVRKGPEDAFAVDADSIKSDENLEKLIRKGADNPFAVGKDEPEVTDPSLEEAVKKDDDPFGGFAGGEGLTVSDDDSNAAAFGIKKDDDVFGGGSDDGFGSGFADFGIKKDDDAFAAGDDDSIGSGFADFGIKKDDDAFAGSDDDSIGSGFAE